MSEIQQSPMIPMRQLVVEDGFVLPSKTVKVTAPHIRPSTETVNRFNVLLGGTIQAGPSTTGQINPKIKKMPLIVATVERFDNDFINQIKGINSNEVCFEYTQYKLGESHEHCGFIKNC